MRRSSFLLVAIAMIATVLFGVTPTQAQVPTPVVKVLAERLDCTTIRIIDAYHNTNDVLDVSLRWNVGYPAVTYSGTGEPTKSGAWSKTFKDVPMPESFFILALNSTSANKTKYYVYRIPGCELKGQVVPAKYPTVVSDSTVQDDGMNYVNNSPKIKLVKSPKIVGTATVGNTVSSSFGVWKPRATNFTTEWFRLVKGHWRQLKTNQGISYTIRPADKGHQLIVMLDVCSTDGRCGLAVSKPVLVK